MPDHWRHMYAPEDVDLPVGVPNMDARRRCCRTARRLVRRPGQGQTACHAAYDKKPAGEPETEAEIRQFIAEYYGLISNIDWNVGRC